jgi:tetratricopeptide (TPR) repeat protein
MSRITPSIVLSFSIAVSGCGQSERAEAPASSGPASFVGSTACQSCHEPEYQDWMGSHHELAMQIANAETVLGDFADASFDYFDTVTQFSTRDDGFYVRTADASGEDRDFRIAFTFGVEPLQQYLIEFPGGRLQTLAYTWDTRPASEGGQRWFHMFPDEYIAPDDVLHWTGLQQNWNYMCAECHSTNLKMGFEAASNSFDTTYSEISVGCESCHGPASKHVEQANGDAHGAPHGFDVDLDDQKLAAWIMNAETGIAERSEARIKPQQQPEACGRCHSRRGIIAPDYEYGEPLLHTHMPTLLDDNLYFADGQILEEVYVYGSFLQSKMYQAGVTCSDCHNPHSADLLTGPNPNDVCAQCHLPTKFAVAEHAAHAPEQAGCVDCHMTSRTYMVVDDRRDHSFRVPRPDLTASAGVPNACSNCHAQKDAAWAATAIADWRGSAAPPLAPNFATALAASRHGFANNALLEVISNHDYPGIARATAVSQLSDPFSTREFLALEAALGSPDAQIRIAALRQLRSLPTDLRMRLPGARLLGDSIRGVRIEAATSYAGMSDLLPLEEARAWPTAESELRQAYGALANRPEALAALANFEMDEQNIAEAALLYERALLIEPRAAAARTNLADLLRQLGEEGRAQEVLREGIVLDKTNAALRHALGLSLVRSADHEGALHELRQAAEYDPDNARFAYVLGVALNSMDQQPEALDVLRHAYDRFEGNFDVAMVLATILRDSGDRDGALDIAYSLARRHPENQNVLALLRSLGALQ